MWFCKFVVVVCFALCVLDAESKSRKCAKGNNKTETHNKEDWNDSSSSTNKDKDFDADKPDDTEWTDSNDNTTKTQDAEEFNLGGTQNASSNNLTAETGTLKESSTINNSTGQYNQTQPQNTTQSSANATANVTQSEVLQNTTTSQQEAESSTGYWIPIFNFGNDLYFGTNKGYAKLVNFPAPVIYSFLPVAARENFPFAGKRTQGEPRQEFVDSTGNYFENEPNFSDCYVNQELGNMIPYSYFGNWVAVFNLENGWHLQTYGGFVALDMNGSEVPVTYEFDPIVYQYTSTPTPAPQTQGNVDPGLSQWNEPVVMED